MRKKIQNGECKFGDMCICMHSDKGAGKPQAATAIAKKVDQVPVRDITLWQ